MTDPMPFLTIACIVAFIVGVAITAAFVCICRKMDQQLHPWPKDECDEEKTNDDFVTSRYKGGT